MNDIAPTIHDDQLFSMLKDCKQLWTFFDNIFGFLSRRTDFYCIANDELNALSAVGLPPGYAEQIVKSTFYKWKQSSVIAMTPDDNNDMVLEEVLVPEAKVVTDNTTKLIKRIPDSPFTASEYYNGAMYSNNYCWSQSLTEIDIYINIPNKVTTKDLIVDITSNRISVKLKQEQQEVIILDGELCDKCKYRDAIWSLDRSKLNIHLDKTTERWWNCLLQCEDRLDVSKLDCSRPYEDLPAEAHAKIEELQWNQERKRLGLPTSDEMAMHSVLKDAWYADGSPFSGPFDPTSVQF